MSDPNPPPGILENIHAGWTAIFSAVALFFIRRTIKQLDEKADKEALEDHKMDTDRKFADMQAAINRAIDTQADQHAANITRLDNILLAVTDKRRN